MTRERLSYIVARWVCILRGHHEYGRKFRDQNYGKWYQKCVICGHSCEAAEPKKRGKSEDSP